MNEPRDPNETLDVGTASGRTDPDEAANPTVDLGSLTADSLEVGLAAAFGRNPGPPRSTLGSMRPVVLKEAEGESSLVVTPRSDAMPPKADVGDRYQLSGEIARGGMGAVLRGRDVDLGRDLAVKVLLERHANRPDVAQRFIEEAQIGGQLQHPGVVPVYDIGRFGDRPFFTMKLVKGQTLAAILGERTDPAADRPRLLAIALQVAQAMAYAHAKGVIHRDLKPANIMVGAFGEVQVMDWGLAKVLAEGGVADEERASRAHQEPEDVTTIRTARSTGSHGSFGTDTEAGSILGTPAYMPPEQASGDVALLDRRADVFALGAILCEILTGKPPYLGRSSEEVRRKAANGELADATARLDACWADLELVGLTKACLAREAVDRPRDAQGVVDALTAHLDGVQERLQTAERERAVASAREVEERERRKVQLALAASVALLLFGGGGVAWWQNEQASARRETDLRRKLVDEQRAAADNARLARNAEAVSGLLAQADEALLADDAAKAAVALDAARKRAAEGGAENEADRLKRLDADLALLRDLDAVDKFRWTPVENKLPDAAAVATRTRDVLRRFGADPEATSADDAAARVSASALRARIVSALDRLLRQDKAAGVRAVLRNVDADPYRDAVRDAVLAGESAKVADLAGRADALGQPPGFVALLGESGAIPVDRRRQLLQAAVGRRPGDLGLLMTLGGSYPIKRTEGADDRVRWFQAAVASAPANSGAHNNLGIALYDKVRLDEAIASYTKAIELDPKFALAHNNLGNALNSKGRPDEAIASYTKAIELDPKSAFAHSGLGSALRDKGRPDEAIASYTKAIELDPKYAVPHYNLGVVLCDKGQLDEAIASYRKAIELDSKYAVPHCNLGVVLYDKGQLDEAIASYRKAIELDSKYALAHNNLGYALRRMGRLDEAIASIRKAIELDPKCVPAHTNLGDLLETDGRLDEAIASYKKAIELDPKNTFVVSYLLRAERSAAARDKFPGYQNGSFTPKTNEERLGLAEICMTKKLYRSAAGLYAAAFAADPKLADDWKADHRYTAAFIAALAAAGQGDEAAQLDDAERTRLRRQALDWLRAHLALLTRQIESANRAATLQSLRHWQQDSDLATVRDAGSLAKLPDAERKEWEALWADVEALLKRAQGPKS
jgi:eukaryotic-like serine/threonine-protein kinase